MNIFRKTLIFAVSLASMTILSGCWGTYFSGQVVNIGKTEYYADFSRIEEQKVYEVNEEYFIKAPVLEYDPSPECFGHVLFLEALNKDFTKTGESQQPLWIKLKKGAKEWLCEEDIFWILCFDGEIAQKSPDFTTAVTHSIRRSPAPQKREGGLIFTDEMVNTAYLGYSRDWTGYAAMPLLLVTVPVDIVTTIVCLPVQCIYYGAFEYFKTSDNSKSETANDISKTTDDKNKK